MDKNIVRSLKGLSIKLPKSLTNLDDYATWGIATASRKDSYIEVNRNDAGGGWGIVSNKIGNIKADEVYILEFTYKTYDLERFSYNYFISEDGNAVIGRLDCINDGNWHTQKIEISTNKDRDNCGILLGTDFRNTSGDSFFIRSIKLYPKNNAELVYEDAKEIKTFTNGKWIKTIGRTLINSKWIEFIRPPIEFNEGPIGFETLIRYKIKQIDKE